MSFETLVPQIDFAVRRNPEFRSEVLEHVAEAIRRQLKEALNPDTVAGLKAVGIDVEKNGPLTRPDTGGTEAGTETEAGMADEKPAVREESPRQEILLATDRHYHIRRFKNADTGEPESLAYAEEIAETNDPSTISAAYEYAECESEEADVLIDALIALRNPKWIFNAYKYAAAGSRDEDRLIDALIELKDSQWLYRAFKLAKEDSKESMKIAEAIAGNGNHVYIIKAFELPECADDENLVLGLALSKTTGFASMIRALKCTAVETGTKLSLALVNGIAASGSEQIITRAQKFVDDDSVEEHILDCGMVAARIFVKVKEAIVPPTTEDPEPQAGESGLAADK